jgi:uncharacterized protein YndB with AHSA1/START domain
MNKTGSTKKIETINYMDPGTEVGTKSHEGQVVITRTFDEQPDLVFKAWTDPRILAQWWGPKGFTNPVCELDFRPGGTIYIDMRTARAVTKVTSVVSYVTIMYYKRKNRHGKRLQERVQEH